MRYHNLIIKLQNDAASLGFFGPITVENGGVIFTLHNVKNPKPDFVADRRYWLGLAKSGHKELLSSIKNID